MREHDYLVLGGGLTAVNAVEGIRQVDADGSVAVLSAEEEPPYHRPPLSKEYLQAAGAGRELLHVKPEGWYEDRGGVELRRGVRATGLDPAAMEVATSDGEQIRADRILIATGGRPRTLDLPGQELDGVGTFRTVDDAEALREAAGRVDHAVLVGAGFIGMELAASLRELDVSPTVVEREDRVWSRMLPPELSAEMQAYFEERDVAFRTGATVREFRGDGRVEAVVLDDGTELACGLAVVGVGIRPNQELAAEAGLAADDGVLVDEFGETSHGHVYAAGDVARFPDPVFGDRVRVEHWDHAKAHGRRVGRNLAGEREPYEHLSYFFTDVFELSLNVFGRPAGADRTIRRGEVLDEEGGVVLCGSDGRLCGAILVNDSSSMEACRELVRRRPPMEDVAGRLSDPGVDLAEVAG